MFHLQHCALQCYESCAYWLNNKPTGAILCAVFKLCEMIWQIYKESCTFMLACHVVHVHILPPPPSPPSLPPPSPPSLPHPPPLPLPPPLHHPPPLSLLHSQLGLEDFNAVNIIGFNSKEWLIANNGAMFAG